MRIKLRSFWSTLALFFLIAFSQQAVAAGCNKPKVYFVNGVWNTEAQANRGGRKLESAIKVNGGPTDLKIETIPNPTNGELGDLVEVAMDEVITGHLVEAAKVTARFADGLVVIYPSVTWWMLHPKTGRSITDWLQNLLSVTPASARNEMMILRIHDKLLNDAKQGPVVVIAHSQGNFYLNEAIRRLKTEEATKDIPGVQSIAVLGIAVASSFNPASLPNGAELYRYITRDDDAVIGLLRNVPPPNYTTLTPSHTATSHELIQDYLWPFVRGTYYGVADISIQKTVASEFLKVYNAAISRFPCGFPQPVWKMMDLPYTSLDSVESCAMTTAVDTKGLASFNSRGPTPMCTNQSFTYDLAAQPYRVYLYPDYSQFKLFPSVGGDWFLQSKSSSTSRVSSGSLNASYRERRAEFLNVFDKKVMSCSLYVAGKSSTNIIGKLLVRDDGVWLSMAEGDERKLGRLPESTADYPLVEEYDVNNGSASLSDKYTDKRDSIAIALARDSPQYGSIRWDEGIAATTECTFLGH